jgi:predicted  nucleic acid-binding Zn-ribbon protein
MTLEGQLAQLVPRLQEQENANSQLTEEIVMLRERISVLDNQIAHYQQSHGATQELVLQLEVS